MKFRVSDSGIGIPADKRGALFQRFTQADTSTARMCGSILPNLVLYFKVASSIWFRDILSLNFCRSLRFGGSGLGLSLAKGLVTAMGGEIEALDTPGQPGLAIEFSVFLRGCTDPVILSSIIVTSRKCSDDKFICCKVQTLLKCLLVASPRH